MFNIQLATNTTVRFRNSSQYFRLLYLRVREVIDALAKTKRQALKEG